MELLGRPKARAEPRRLARPRPQRHRRARRASDVDGRRGWRIARGPRRVGQRDDARAADGTRSGCRSPRTRRRRARVSRDGATAAAAAAANDLRGYVPRTDSARDLGSVSSTTTTRLAPPRTHFDDDDHFDSPEQHQTHDVIITEIEEINLLTDYMQQLQAPTFSEALATARLAAASGAAVDRRRARVGCAG